MSYSASADLFYGARVTEEELRTLLSLPEEGDNYEDYYELLEKLGFKFVMSGNMVCGDDTEYGIAIAKIDMFQTGIKSIKEHEMIIPESKLDKLKDFMKTCSTNNTIGWHLGVSYG